MTVRPLDNLDFGPVGLWRVSSAGHPSLKRVYGGAPHNYRALFVLRFFEGRLRSYKGFRRPILNEFIDLLFRRQQQSRRHRERAQASSDRVTYDLFCVEYLGERR